jgi:PAT family beta-lactamase induction signal transducer AmpG
MDTTSVVFVPCRINKQEEGGFMSYCNQTKIINPRLWAVLLFGFSSGLPLALVGATLQAWFTKAHVPLATIGFLSLLGIPYTFKFLWAPLLDRYRLPYLGKRKGWIVISQFGLILSLLLFAHYNPSSHAMQMGIIAFFIAILSATQDIAIDAYRTDILPSQERGLGSAYTIFGYRIAVLISGGLALIFADYWGFAYTYQIMAGLILLTMIPAMKAPATIESEQTTSIFATISGALADLLQRDKIFLILLFIIFYKIGDALALQLMTNFLLNGLHFSLTEIGIAYKFVSFVATILGAFIGGIILFKYRLYQGLLWFGLAQAFSNLMFIWLAIIGKNFTIMALAMFIENFCSGMSTAALLAFIMSLCHSRYTATQISLLSAIASLGRVFLGPLAALMVEMLGWTQFFIWSFFLCFPGIVMLLFLKLEDTSYAPVAAD